MAIHKKDRSNTSVKLISVRVLMKETKNYEILASHGKMGIFDIFKTSQLRVLCIRYRNIKHRYVAFFD